MTLNAIEDVVNSDLCIGCGLCQAILGQEIISINLSADGFLVPTVHGDYSNSWKMIKRVCPGIRVERPLTSNRLNQRRDKIWGSLYGIEIGHAVDDETRRIGSSGGAISAILCYMLDTNMVDYVLQVGVNQLNPLVNEVHINRDRQGVLRCAGSRYSPSAPLLDFTRIVDLHKGNLAVVGRPCDISALRTYLATQPHISDRVICLITFFCAGTSSMQGTEALLTRMGASRNDIREFRYRGNGWPGKTRAVMQNGDSFELDYDIAWGTVLNQYLHFRCKICPDGIGESGDITCADGWYLSEGRPSFEESPHELGRSIIVSRTPSGAVIVQNAVQSRYLETEPFELSNLAAIQPYQARRRKEIASRLSAMLVVGANAPSFPGFDLLSNALQLSFKDNWLGFSGMLARSIGKGTSRRRRSVLFVQHVHLLVYRVVSRLGSLLRLQKPVD